MHLVFNWCQLELQVRITRDKHRKRCRGYGHVRFRTSAQASAAVDGMHRFQFKQGHFLSALPSDENRTLFLGGIPESWEATDVKAVLLYAFPGMRRYARLFNLKFKVSR
jgi:RNA recognition motif. (a.k.a. RRM, RBD, or RNP domain)